MQQLVNECCLLKRVWKATKPVVSCPEEMTCYTNNAKRFIATLKMYFAYTRSNMSNYIHKMLAYVPQLLEEYGSIGAFSSEPNEHGNKLFRQLRKMCARQQTDFELWDILKFHWLYTVRSLQELVNRTVWKQKCSVCNIEGHKRSTCPGINEL